MPFGYFDNKNLEYVIEKPNTPLPWINYLGEKKYCALISNTAGGYSFYIDPRERRILRYRYDNIPFDQGGRYIYIRDDKTGEFFSPTWQPTQTKLDQYECRHGLGYSTISSTYNGIETKITYFVPVGEDLEIWKVVMRNLPAGRQGATSVKREISLFSFVEFCLWDTVGDSTNFQRTWSIGKAHCEGSTIIHDTMYGNWVDILAYFGTSAKIDSFDCQRRDFLGNNGYNSLANPEAVINGKCSNSTAIGWAPIGSHCIKLNLKPGQTKEIIFVLGVSKNKNIAEAKVKKFTNPKRVEAEFNKLKKYWQANLSKIQVETPDKDLDTSINIWNQYQCMQTFNWSRYASYYEAGIGRGMGFRDSNQDTLGFAHMIPHEAKKRILELASIQFEDGSAYHQYSPITGKGALYGYSDDQLWLVISTANYIKETGDFKILYEIVPFAEKQTLLPAQMGHHDYCYKPQNSKPEVKKDMLYNHLKKAIEFSLTNIGPHGLPKSGFADWNDCLNMIGPNDNAESVFTAELLVFTAGEMVRISEIKNLSADKVFFENASREMIGRINKHCWDGDWYLRAFDDNSKPLGTKKSKAAKIFLETQPWSVISGTAGEKGIVCMNSVKKYLKTKFGIKLLHPPFSSYRPELGEISTYPAGLKENASIFCHPNPWAIVAECILGRGDLAFEYFKAILPESQNSEIRKTEPYVYCQMVAGPDHPDFGEGKNSWLTGSAAWNFYAATNYILGIKPDYDGLIISPCIPKGWKQFNVIRMFRGAKYNIHVKKNSTLKNDVKFLIVDGRRMEGNKVPVFHDRKEHTIEAHIS